VPVDEPKRNEEQRMELESAIKGRRSIRRFRSDEIPKELLEDVISTALWAPSGMNRQDWEIVVARGEHLARLLEVVSRSQGYVMPLLQQLFPEKIIKISLQVFNNLGDAPAVILIYTRKEILHFSEDLDERRRFQIEFTRFSRLLSASALIQNLLLCAHEKGLGTCWMIGPKYMEKEINELLGITDRELISIIPIGFPAQSPPAPPRKEGVVHWLGF
jgi:nitroreductase